MYRSCGHSTVLCLSLQIGIWAELKNSKNTLTSTFDYTYILWLRRWALMCFALIVILFLVRAFLSGRERHAKRRNADDNDYKRMGGQF